MNPTKIFFVTIGLISVELASRLVLGGNLQPFIILGYSFGTLLLAIYFDWLIPSLTLNQTNLGLTLWINLFIVGSFINMIEGWFFTTIFSNPLDFLVGAIYVFIVSGIKARVSIFVMPAKGSHSIILNLKTFIKSKGTGGFLRSFILGGLGYFPIYFIFGALISPFIINYYSDPSFGLVIPPLTLIIPLEILRGFMFTVALLPIIVALKPRRTIFIACAVMLFIPGSLIPLIGDVGLPVQIIPYHTIELFCDSIVYGYLLARLFSLKALD